jgi:hypothetical protein
VNVVADLAVLAATIAGALLTLRLDRRRTYLGGSWHHELNLA